MANTSAPDQIVHVFDDAAAAEFAGKAIGYLNAGSVATLLSIGHQTHSSTPWPGCHHRAATRSPPLQS